jgi:hypothetical protein
MISEVNERGPIFWYSYHQGIRGGVLKLLIYKNRMSFVKLFSFCTNDKFNLSVKILTDNYSRILHMKNHTNPQIGRLASYAVDATKIQQVSKKDFDTMFDKNEPTEIFLVLNDPT